MADSAPSMVPAVNPQGELVRIDAGDVQRALAQGFTLPNADQLADIARHEKASGFLPGLASAAEGAASALTFGLAPKAETALGITTPEDIQARKEEHPIAHGLGELAGVAAPLILTAGAAAPAEGAAAAARAVPLAAEVAGEAGVMVPAAVTAARAAEGAGGVLDAARAAAQWTAPGLIGRAGQAAQAAVEGAGLPGALGRFAPVMAQGAVEGGLYAGSDVMERRALGDPSLTAESALAEMGMGALFGGGLMGLGKAAAEGFSAALQKVSAGARRAAERLASGESKDSLKIVLSEESQPSVIALDKAAPGAADALASAAYPETTDYLIKHASRVAEVEAAHPGTLNSVLVKATPEEAQYVLDNADGIINGAMERNRIGQTLTDQITNTFQQTSGAVRAAWRDARSAEMESLAAKADPAAVAKQTSDVILDLTSKMEELKRAPELYTPGSGTRLERLGEGLMRDVKDAATPADVYVRLNRLKQSLDDLIPWGAEASTAAGRDTEALLKDLRGKVKSALEDSGVWGEAGDRQRDFNRSFQAYKDATKRLGAGKSNTLEAKILRKVDDGAGGVTYEANEKTVNAWLNAMANARGGAKSSAFNDYLDKAEALAGQMQQSGYEGADALGSSIRQMRANFAVTERRAAVNEIINRLQNPGGILVSQGYIPTAGSLAKEAGTAAFAHVVPGGGAVTRTASAIWEKARSPSMMVGVLAGLDRLASKTAAAIDGRAARIFSGEASAVAGSSARAVTPENFPNAAADLQRYGGDLHALADTVSQHTEGISDHAPATADALAALAARGVQHLASALPQTPAPLPLSRPYQPSRAELIAYNQAHEVAANPLAVLDHLAQGTLSIRHVQAAETIWPKLTQEMRARTMDAMAAHIASGKGVPMKSRLALSMFLGQDLDHSTTQATIAANQAAIAAAPKPAVPGAEGAPGGNAPSGGGKAKALKSTSARFATAAQHAQDRDVV